MDTRLAAVLAHNRLGFLVCSAPARLDPLVESLIVGFVASVTTTHVVEVAVVCSVHTLRDVLAAMPSAFSVIRSVFSPTT